MITTITEFKLPKPITPEEARGILLTTAPKYRDVAGLFHKRYILSQDGTRVGGIYLGKSLAEAEAMYTESWRDFVRENYGSDPLVSYFDTPVVVDNVTHEMISNE